MFIDDLSDGRRHSLRYSTVVTALYRLPKSPAELCPLGFPCLIALPPCVDALLSFAATPTNFLPPVLIDLIYYDVVGLSEKESEQHGKEGDTRQTVNLHPAKEDGRASGRTPDQALQQEGSLDQLPRG